MKTWNRLLFRLILFAFAVAVYVFFVMQVFTRKIPRYTHEGTPQGKATQKKVIVLVSQPRTGSSFLGTFLNEFETVFYLYEPFKALMTLSDRTMVTSDKWQNYKTSTIPFLRELFRCQFTRSYENILTKNFDSFFRHFSRALDNLCGNISSSNANICSEPRSHVFNYLCQTHDTLFVKFLEPRLPVKLSRLFELMSNADSFYVIYLWRDPRASFWSMLNKGWISETVDARFEKYIAERCSEMNSNLRDIRNMNRDERKILILRQEDYVRRPHEFFKILSNFIEMEFPAKVRNEFIGKMHNSFGCLQNGSFRENLDSEWLNWRIGADESLIRLVEQHCQGSMLDMGYLVSLDFDNYRNCETIVIDDKEHSEIDIFSENEIYDDDEDQ